MSRFFYFHALFTNNLQIILKNFKILTLNRKYKKNLKNLIIKQKIKNICLLINNINK